MPTITICVLIFGSSQLYPALLMGVVKWASNFSKYLRIFQNAINNRKLQDIIVI